MASDTQTILRRVRRTHGWSVRIRPGGHYLIRSPSGAQIFTGATPSKPSSTRNLVARLRREGFPRN